MGNGIPNNGGYLEPQLGPHDYHTTHWADELVSKYPDRHSLDPKSGGPSREIIDVDAYHPMSPMAPVVQELFDAKRRQLDKLGLDLQDEPTNVNPGDYD